MLIAPVYSASGHGETVKWFVDRYMAERGQVKMNNAWAPRGSEEGGDSSSGRRGSEYAPNSSGRRRSGGHGGRSSGGRCVLPPRGEPKHAATASAAAAEIGGLSSASSVSAAAAAAASESVSVMTSLSDSLLPSASQSQQMVRRAGADAVADDHSSAQEPLR